MTSLSGACGRRLAAGLFPVVLVVAGCSSAQEPADAEGRTVATSLGEVTVPETVGSVVVLEGRRDLDIALPITVGGVLSVKFTSEADESNEPGFAELEAFGP